MPRASALEVHDVQYLRVGHVQREPKQARTQRVLLTRVPPSNQAGIITAYEAALVDVPALRALDMPTNPMEVL